MELFAFYKSLRRFALIIPVFLAVADLSAAERPINLKLGTIAPSGSTYHQSLQAMGEQWRNLPSANLRLTIFAGGTQGGEADMVGLMQTGNLDAGLLTAVGLSEIEPAVTALQSMPMSFRTLAEVDYVGEHLRPLLEKRLAAKGYTVLFWTDSGWVRFFTKSPVLHPADLKKLKVFAWAGQTHEYDLWKSSGCNPVSLETKDIPQGLLSGTISAVAVPPVFALFGQLDGQAKYMLELNWAPLVGAAVVRNKFWERLSPDLRQAMFKIAAETGQKVKAAGRAENENAVTAMTKRGLVVQKVTPEVIAEWQAEIDKIQDQIRSKIVPADMYDEAQRLLKQYRSSPEAKRP
jgi:TRAP-type transport system periplasmic protein